MKFAAVFLILGIVASACVLADTYYVDDDGPAGNNMLADAGLLDIIIYPNIQAAIDDSNDGDTIIIMPGIYTGEGNRNLDFKGKAITVRSSDPNNPDVVASTIIDCEDSGRGFYFHSGEDSSSVVCGLTIINAYAANYGAGIFCDSSHPVIGRCVIRDSVADYGGGISCFNSSAVIESCVIEDNNGLQQGGGIYSNGNGLIERCIINRNRSGDEGGGIYCLYPRIKDSIIVGNKAENSGGGIFCEESMVINCTIAANIAIDGIAGGIYGSGSQLFSSILWGNVSSDSEYNQLNCAAKYCCIQDEDANDVNIPDGFGNIDDYPEFVRDPNDGGDGFGDDPCTPGIDEGANDDLGDLHLTRISPCINAGLPNYIAGVDDLDIDDEPRIIGGRVDMGADEYTLMIAVIVPQGGEVWAADSNHTIVWASYDIGQNVDIQLSDNNGVDWDVVADDVNNDGSFLLNLPDAVDSNQCIIKVVPVVPDANVLCIPSGLFTIQPYNPNEPVESLWPTLGKDYYRRGLSDFNGPQLGCVKWVFDTNGPVTAGVAAGDQGQVYAACRDGNLYAIDVNGNLLWKYDANTPLLSTPSIGRDGTVYVGGESGLLYAIDTNGQLRWTHTTGAYVSASPAVSSDGRVFAASQDGKLYALAPDGSELWEFETAGLGRNTKGSIIGSPAIDSNGVVYVAGLYDPNLYALDANNGEIIWSCLLSQPLRPPDLPPVCPWPFEKKGNPDVSPVIGLDGTIYMLLMGDPHLYAVEPNEGSIKWSLDLADIRSYWFGPEFSDTFYFKSGSTSWRYGKWYGSGCFSEPVIGPDGTIYVSFDDPYLRAISPDGMVKWLTRLGMVGGFTMAAGYDGLVYAGSDDGAVYVVDSNGLEISRFVVNDVDILSCPVIPGEGQLVISDSNNRIWSISDSNCEDLQISLFRPEDLYSDGIINFKDFAVLAMNWLECTDRYFYAFDGSSVGHCDYHGNKIYFEGDVNRDLYVDDKDLYVDNKDLTGIAYNWLNAERPVYEKPRIKITNPKNGDYFERFDEVIIEIDAYDPDGSIVRVELLDMELLDYYPNVRYNIIDEDLDGNDGWGPFIVDAGMGRNSTYRYILVRAVDNNGFVSYSEVKITIEYRCFRF